MGHEGIQTVNEETARRWSAEETVLPRDATVPLHVRVHKTEGTGMEIDWKDGHHSQWSFAWLRDACPCATCVEEREKEGRLPGQPRPKPATLLPMYKAPALPESVTPVGRYALSFHWNDGHQSGIYSWEYLRRVCQCEECTQGKG
jgi:DUF971 family protein